MSEMSVVTIPTDPEFPVVIHECDACDKTYDYEPEDSFQTYNGTWFCSDNCGRKAGW